jgi:hypothetical protein
MERGEQFLTVVRLGHHGEAIVFQEPPDQGSFGVDGPGDGDSDAVAGDAFSHCPSSSPTLSTGIVSSPPNPMVVIRGQWRQIPGVAGADPASPHAEPMLVEDMVVPSLTA